MQLLQTVSDIFISDCIIKMEYWNLTSKARGQRGLSLGTRHRVFSAGIRKHDESKGKEIKSGEKEGHTNDQEDAGEERSETKVEESKEEDKEGGESPTTETGVSSESTDDRPPSGEEKSSDSLKRKRDHTEQETEQEDSKSGTDGEQDGENKQ